MKKIYTLITALAVTGITNANIVYTDIADGQPVGIDFNQDGTMEFDISNSFDGVGDYIEYWNSNPNGNIYAIDGNNWDVAEDLSLNMPIDANGNWEGFGDCMVTGWGGPTNFALNQDRYLGMKFELGGNIHYGWVRVEVADLGNGSYSVTYKDYAYENTANMTINAGDMGGTTGIKNTSNSSLSTSIFPNPTTEVINVTLQNSKKSSIDIEITDITGKVVLKNTIDNNSKVNVEYLDNGIYFLSIKNELEIVSQSFIKN